MKRKVIIGSLILSLGLGGVVYGTGFDRGEARHRPLVKEDRWLAKEAGKRPRKGCKARLIDEDLKKEIAKKRKLTEEEVDRLLESEDYCYRQDLTRDEYEALLEAGEGKDFTRRRDGSCLSWKKNKGLGWKGGQDRHIDRGPKRGRYCGSFYKGILNK